MKEIINSITLNSYVQIAILRLRTICQKTRKTIGELVKPSYDTSLLTRRGRKVARRSEACTLRQQIDVMMECGEVG